MFHLFSAWRSSSSSSTIKDLVRRSILETQKNSQWDREVTSRKAESTSLFVCSALETFSRRLPSASQFLARLDCPPASTADKKAKKIIPSTIVPLFTKILEREAREATYSAECASGKPPKGPKLAPSLLSPPSSGSSTMHNGNTPEEQAILKPPRNSKGVVMASYDPFWNEAYLQRVAAQVRIEETLQYASHLLHRIQEDKSKNAALLLYRVKQQCTQGRFSSCSVSGSSLDVEEASGILTRLKMCNSSSSRSSARTQTRRLRASIPHKSNIQVNEILPNGKVVTLTEPTLPHHILPTVSLRKTLDAQLQEQWRKQMTANRLSSSLTSSVSHGVSSTLYQTHAWKGEAARQEVETKGPPRHATCTMYLHFLLFRQGMSWREVRGYLVETLQSAFQREPLPRWDGFSVTWDSSSISLNVCMEDDVTSTQLCSLALNVLPSQSAEGSHVQGEKADTLASLHAIDEAPLRRYGEVLYHALSILNLRCSRLSIQLLGWRSFGCALQNASGSQKQYAILLRYVQHAHDVQRVEANLQHQAMAFPNFFCPQSFGSLDCPFRSYHILAAMDKGAIREALLMAYCFVMWPELDQMVHMQQTNRPFKNGVATPSPPLWTGKLLSVLYSDEDRPSYLREALVNILPPSLLVLFQRSKAHLLWNTLASCRLHDIPHPRSGVLTDFPCAIGDVVKISASIDSFLPSPAFVADADGKPILEELRCMEDTTRNEKALTPEALLLNAWSDAVDAPVRNDCGVLRDHLSTTRRRAERQSGRTMGCLLSSEEEAVSHSLMEVVLPLPYGSAFSDSEVLSKLSDMLGFPVSSLYGSYSRGGDDERMREVHYRPLFRACTGFPHASRPWVKVLEEPSEASSHYGSVVENAKGKTEGDDSGTGMESESVPYRLFSDAECGGSSAGRNFTANSRGKSATLRPLDRLGRRMVDRLPTGLLAASSARSSSRHSLSPASVAKSVAFHGTIAGDASMSNFLREVVIMES